MYNDWSTPNVNYAYDLGGNRLTMSDINGSTTYTYDEMDRLLSVTTPDYKTVSYRYDRDGNRRKLLYPDSTFVNYSFDKIGRLESMNDWGNRTTSYQYFEDGALKQTNNVNSTTASYTYDNARRLTQVWNKKGADTISKHTYTLNAAGNRTQLDEDLLTIGGPPPIASGFSHSLAMKTDGSLWSWGNNSNGQLGDGTTTGRLIPVQVMAGGGPGFFTGTTWTSAGDYHSLAVKSDGTAWGWGQNVNGQIGDGTNISRNTPAQVAGLSSVKAVSGGGQHSVALKSDGTVWAWGANTRGQLGDGTTTPRTSPVQVRGPMGSGFLTGITAVAAGTDHGLALKDDGTVWAWGRNDDGQVGNGMMSGPDQLNPVQVRQGGGPGFLTGVAGLAAGGFHSAAVLTDGTMRTWGRGVNGQLGNGSTYNASEPVQVSNLTGVTSAAGGDQFTLALKSDGSVWAWGDNQYGQLGDGMNSMHTLPFQVREPNGPGTLSGIKAIAAGGHHSLATDGNGWSWGRNDAGQLGDGTTMPQNRPVQVSGLSTIGAGAGIASRSTTYQYDRLSRLTNVDAPGTNEDTAYTYDPVGNRLSKTRGTTTSYSYDRADRITMAGATSYTVDANGNTIYRGPDSFTYDRANRLNGSMVGGPTVNYSYNGDGVRISKSLPGTTTNYVNDVNRSLPVVLDDGTRKYVWGLGLAYEVEGSNAFTYHTDGLGSVRAISDSTGTTAQTYRTDEFGLPMDTRGASAQPFRYTGEQRDAETGFMNLRARYYDSSIGRFATRDRWSGTAPKPLSLNRFSYVLNDPIGKRDPSGACVDPGGSGLRYCIERFIGGPTMWGFNGDNRGPNANGGTFKMRQLISRAQDGSLVASASPGSSMWDPSIPFLGGRGAWGGLGDCAAAKSRALGGTNITASCSVSHGLLRGLAVPPILTDVSITETADGASVSVAGTPYPSVEVWQYGGSEAPSLLYSYDAEAAGRSPWDLRSGRQQLP